ncbi:hypothetical protein LUZ60_004688 [Juncus effusus]|nr:hypothetical protein LUZ60_004688 [Juncus effusus]
MPRVNAVESPGCPPLRALTADSLGLIKVVEVRGKDGGKPKVVETWGPLDASRSVLAASYLDRVKDPVLAVARKNGSIEFLNTINGDTLATIKAEQSNEHLVGLHLLNKSSQDSSSLSATILACSEKGKVSLKSISMCDSDLNINVINEWSVTNGGQVLCSSMDSSSNYALFGGKHVEINLWDLSTCNKIWNAKPPKPNNLGLSSPTWFTASTFLCKDDHRKIVTGTGQHQVRLYDIGAQKRAVISIDFRESPIKSLREDTDGHTVYVGTTIGDLASFDMRTGKMLGCYKGKCSGSIRSIAKHPNLPLLASCGLDSWLRIWDTNTRQLLSEVFLKQHLTCIFFDSHFTTQELEGTKFEEPASHLEINDQSDEEKNDEEKILKLKKKKKKAKIQDEGELINGDLTDEPSVSKRKITGEKTKSKKKKSKKNH